MREAEQGFSQGSEIAGSAGQSDDFVDGGPGFAEFGQQAFEAQRGELSFQGMGRKAKKKRTRWRDRQLKAPPSSRVRRVRRMGISFFAMASRMVSGSTPFERRRSRRISARSMPVGGFERFCRPGSVEMVPTVNGVVFHDTCFRAGGLIWVLISPIVGFFFKGQSCPKTGFTTIKISQKRYA